MMAVYVAIKMRAIANSYVRFHTTTTLMPASQRSQLKIKVEKMKRQTSAVVAEMTEYKLKLSQVRDAGNLCLSSTSYTNLVIVTSSFANALRSASQAVSQLQSCNDKIKSLKVRRRLFIPFSLQC